MRILGLLESCLFEQTTVAVILMPDASQVCMGGPWTLSAASGISECILALWQLQISPHLPMPGGSYPVRQRPTHFPCEGQYFGLWVSKVLDTVAQR